MSNVSSIAQNLKHIQERIASAAIRSRRDPAEVKLVAVSKTFTPDAILAAYHAGQRHFGENRPEEGANKIPFVVEKLEGPPPMWHMIGHIQSRKAALVIQHFDMVHSIDRLSVATRLSGLAQAAQRTIPVLIECNVSGEVSKYGFTVAGWESNQEVLQSFINDFALIEKLPGLKVTGLMTMPPLVQNAEDVRPFFASLRHLCDEMQKAFPETLLHHLSMGMSNDFEVAVEEGATMVRIGRAIFGERH